MNVEYQLMDDVAMLRLNRPERYNAIDSGLVRDFIAAIDAAEAQSRALVLTGNGKAFCSGADLAELMEGYESGTGPDLNQLLDTLFHPMIQALIGCSVPTIAALNGVAAGAGVGIALGCDLRVMSEEAYLTSAFTAIGLAPDSGTTWWLPHHLGVSRALEFALTNRRISADEAVDLGLSVKFCAQENLMETALSYATEFADMATDSLVTTRRLIRNAASITFQEALDAERVEQGRLGKTPQHREGVKAFQEKRRPDFRAATP